MSKQTATSLSQTTKSVETNKETSVIKDLMNEIPLIEFKHVKKRYKSGVIALQDLSLDIKNGEFVYIIGSTGAGKSTLIKLLDGEEKVTSGEIYVRTQRKHFALHKMFKFQVPRYRREIGVIYQDFKLLPRKTVYENVYFSCEIHNLKHREAVKRTRDVLKLVGLSSKANAYPEQLSGGEQQRVAIARAIVSRPRLLIADEPTGNLDPQTSQDIIELLRTINQDEDTTIIVVTHNENIVNTYKHRTLVIQEGLLAADLHKGGYLHDEKAI